MPSGGIPSCRPEREANEALSSRCDSIQRWLCEPPRRPPVENPIFVELLTGNSQNVLTIEQKDSHCMPVFSSPFRAADYVRTLIVSGPPVAYLSSSPLELLTMFRDLRQVGVDEFTLDRCPRCEAFCAISTASMTTTDDVINCWSIFKSMELARLEQFLDYAQAAARAEQFYTARDVLLEAAIHVGVEDPRLHLSMGQVALALYDSELLHEAKMFLRFFKLKSWKRRLDQKSRWSDYDFLVADSGLSPPRE